MDTKTCCRQCFEPSRDVLRGPDYMLAEASPEGCNNENCPCHSQDTGWEKKFQFTLNNRMRMNNDALLRNEVPWIMDFIREALTSQREQLATAVEGMMQEWKHPLSPDIERKTAVNNALKEVAALIRNSPNK